MSSRPNQMTAGPIKHFKKGWAVLAFVGQKAHFWADDICSMTFGGKETFYTAACGLTASSSRRLPALYLYPGSWVRCKNCLRSVKGP